MPNITEYNSNVEAPRASDMGAEAFAQEGRRVGAFYHQMGQDTGGTIAAVGDQYEQHETRKEVSQLGASMADAHAQLTTQWNQIAASTDPNKIDEAAQAFRTNVAKPMLDKIGENLSTDGARDMFVKASSGLYDDVVTKTSADAMRINGVAAVSNYVTARKQLSNTVYSDPTSFDNALMLSHLSLDGLQKHSDLPVTERLKLQEESDSELAKSSALGMINANPTAAKSAIADGRFDKYLDATTISTLQNHATEMEKAAVTAAKAQEAEQTRKDKEAFNEAVNKITAASIADDGSLRVPPGANKALQQAALMPHADAGAIRAAVSMNERILKENSKPTSDPTIYSDMTTRMLSDPTDPNHLTARDVYTARAAGQLSDKDTSFLLKGMKGLAADPAKKDADKQFNQFLLSNKSTFVGKNPITGFPLDPRGAQDYYQFEQAARAQYEQAYAKGNWKDVLDAKNQNFLGKLAPQYMSNKKGASVSNAPARFATKEAAEAGYAKLQSGDSFVGPDGVQRWKP